MALLAAAAPFPAAAERGAVDRLAVGGELGGGTMLSSFQRQDLKYGSDVQGLLRLGYLIREPLSAEAAFGGWWFPSDLGYGRLTWIAAGARLAPRLGAVGRYYVDAHAGLGTTGGDNRFAFDAGTGVEIDVSPTFALGPALRYGQVVGSGAGEPVDAKFWSIGLSMTARFAGAAAPPALATAKQPAQPAPKDKDSDGDGVPDRTDACPAEPAGPHPDPARPGCPLKDSDGDGVPDALDACPDVPEGPAPDPDRRGCPLLDTDGDGVPDRTDVCPAEPAGMKPDPARPGCPLPDRDHDFVPDATDACPDKPGAPSPDPRRNGCPGLVLVERARIKINKPVLFATNKATIRSQSFGLLQALAYALTANPEIRKVSIEGHTDGQGSAERNLILSQQRAESVRAWLVAHGVDGDRLDAKGFGDTQPVSSNRTSKGRAANRRVELRIVDPAPPSS